MCGVMWGAIKEQQEEIENLKKEMEELKNGFSRISK
jgi:Tfp pilus assembly protein PilO